MKKFISSLSIIALLLSGYAYAEEKDNVSLEVCKESVENEGIPADEAQEYIANCLKSIAEEERADAESK